MSNKTSVIRLDMRNVLRDGANCHDEMRNQNTLVVYLARKNLRIVRGGLLALASDRYITP